MVPIVVVLLAAERRLPQLAFALHGVPSALAVCALPYWAGLKIELGGVRTHEQWRLQSQSQRGSSEMSSTRVTVTEAGQYMARPGSIRARLNFSRS